MSLYAYIAAPLFNEAERWYAEQLDAWAREAGLDTYLPHRDAGILAAADDLPRIFASDRDAVDRADIIVASLNGVTTDDGTAWELGYGYAKGKHIVGLFTDCRQRSGIVTLNVMIEGCLNHLCRSEDELRQYLKTYVAQHGGK